MTIVDAEVERLQRRHRSHRPVWDEPPTLVGQVFRATLLGFMVLAVLFPIWSIIVTSVSSRAAIADAGGMVVIPRDFDASAYLTLFTWGGVSRAVWTSTLITVIGTAFSLALTVLAAYGLSRPGSMGYRPLLFYFLLPFLIYPPLVPRYLVVTGLGLKNSIWALILPSAISVFNFVVIRGFMQGIPQELIDSARMDGAGEFRILTRIVLPLSKAVIAVVGLFYAVGYWNVWFDALLYIDDNNKWPIQRVLQAYLLAGQAPNNSASNIGTVMPPTLAIKMAVVVVTIAPIALVYPFVQRHFIKGVLIGAVKG
jgi:putative aldouronate transport system permease protein